MSDLEEIFREAIKKSDKCGQCGVITARIGGDSQAHWCCNCGAKLRGNHPYSTAHIPPRIWDDEKKQYTYLKVPMPEPYCHLTTGSVEWMRNSPETRTVSATASGKPNENTRPVFLVEQMRDYGAACCTAGYVAGVKAENARCRQVLTDKRDHYDALPDRALAAQCFDHAQILLGGWAYEAALREEVK